MSAAALSSTDALSARRVSGLWRGFHINPVSNEALRIRLYIRRAPDGKVSAVGREGKWITNAHAKDKYQLSVRTAAGERGEMDAKNFGISISKQFACCTANWIYIAS